MIRVPRPSWLPLAFAVLFVAGAAAASNTGSAFPPATPASVGLDPAAVGALADVVRGYVEKDYAVGGELLMIKDRRTVLHEAFGARDREQDLPYQRDTLCNIRSMTKPITGAAIQLLIDRGKIALDDPVAKYLAGFRNERCDAITIRHLLTHLSGLPLTILTAADEYSDLVSMANAIGERGPDFEVGEKFWYSDAGTDVLAAIVEVVTGETIDAFVERELLRPLGMTDTLYLTEMSDPRVGRVAALYVGGVGTWTRFWSPEPEGEPFYPCAWGSQTLYSTPMDYARFLAMWMDGGNAGQQQILSADAIARTLTPTSPMGQLGSDEPYPTFFPHLRAWYGQMAIVYLPVDAADATSAEPVIIGHSGSDGTSALAWPQRDLIVLYFTQSRGGLSVLRLEEEIDRLILHPERAEVASDEMRRTCEPYLGTYVANYGPFRNVEFTVLLHNGKLAVDVPGQLVFDLKPADEQGRWYFQITDQVFVEFKRNDAGEVERMVIHEPGAVNELPKGQAEPMEEVKLDPEVLQKYVGRYTEPGTDRIIEIFIQNGTLAMKIPEVQVPLELYPPDEEGLWSLKLNAAVRLRFNEDATGEVTSFSSVLPDGTEALRPRIDDTSDEQPDEEEADTTPAAASPGNAS